MEAVGDFALLTVLTLQVVLLIVTLLVLSTARRASAFDPSLLSGPLRSLEDAVREEIRRSREEDATAFRGQREEIGTGLEKLGSSLSDRQSSAAEGLFARLDSLSASSDASAKLLRDEVAARMQSASDGLTQGFEVLSRQVDERLETLQRRMSDLTETLERRQEASSIQLTATLADLRAAQTEADRILKEDLASGLDRSRTALGELANNNIKALQLLASGQQERLVSFETRVGELATMLDTRQEALRAAVDKRLAEVAAASLEANRLLKDDVALVFKQLGESLVGRIDSAATAQKERLDAVAMETGKLAERSEHAQEALRTAVQAKLTEIAAEARANGTSLKEDVARSLKQLSDALLGRVDQGAAAQKDRLDVMAQQVAKLTEKTEQAQQSLREAVEAKLEAVRVDNEKKLEQMRQTVDEKLQSTLEQRLGQSFEVIGRQLEQVHKSVGEMQSLATGVGDLKRVLTNVKARGTYGEVMLGTLLEQILAAEQYAVNVEIKPHSGQRVEYAVRMPGRGEDDGDEIFLPIDAKFPQEDYERLLKSIDDGDPAGIEAAGAALENRLRNSARDIRDKYVDPPRTTDFAIMFLPTEGLYAESLRRPGLVEGLLRDCRVVVTGPTTLAALLNSLQMGFRSLAIQKRSSEVWQILGAVKTEFEKYGDVMDRLKKKLSEASTTIEKVEVRSRAISRKLRAVQSLPSTQTSDVLGLPNDVLQTADLTTEEESVV
jgi:DNA recombination protein RmuC